MDKPVEPPMESSIDAVSDHCYAAPGPDPEEYLEEDRGTRRLSVVGSEIAKGGLKYEVVLEEPKAYMPLKLASPSTSKSSLSIDELKTKLDAAATRRLSFEAEKQAQGRRSSRRVFEANKKRAEELENYRSSVKENLEAKLEITSENREKILEEKLYTLKKHDEKVEKVRTTKRNSMIGDKGEGQGGKKSSTDDEPRTKESM